jgi:hypothetical protein
MSDQQPSLAAVTAGSSAVHLKDGGPITWDELFPDHEAPVSGTQVATTTAGGTQPSATDAAAQTAAANAAAFQLTTKTGTVYKSAEEAIKGIEHKDALIEQLRSRYILERGIDPITGQQVQLQQTVQQSNYMSDQKRYVDDLTAAAAKGDYQGIHNAQTKLIFDALAPLAPVMSNLAKQQAIDTVSLELKDFREFYGSDNYKAALNESPDLKDAIQRSEQDIQHNQRLSGLYKVAYRVSQGLRLPDLLKAQPANAATATVRQTTAPSTLAPAQASTEAPSAQMQTKEGRKALIDKFEAQGWGDKPLV